MSQSKPVFDPTKPFEVEKASFDPTAPFEAVQEQSPIPQKMSLQDSAVDAANQSLRAIPEAVGSGVGFNIAGPVGSGIGAVIGKGASDFASGVESAYRDPEKFIEDLGRLPTKEQVIEQLGQYANTFSLNALLPALAQRFFKGVENAPQSLKESAENLAENATGATRVQAEKFRPGSGRELLDREIVKAGNTADDIAKKASSAVSQAESRIDDALKTLDEKGVKIDANNIVKNIETKISELAEDPSQADTVKKLKSIVDNIINTGKGEITAIAAENTKRGYNAGSKAWLNPAQDTATTEANKIAYRAYMKEVEETAKKFNIDFGNTFKQAKQDFGLMKPIQEAAVKRATQLKQSPIGGFLDTTAMVAGGTIGGPIGLAKGVALAAARRAIAPRIASTSAVTLDSVSKALQGTTQYAMLAKENPQAFTALANTLYKSFSEEKPQQKWIDNGIKKLDRLGEIPTSLNDIKNDSKIKELLLKASNAQNDEQLKKISEQIRNTEAFKKAPKGGPKTSNKYPMTLRQNGFKVTVKNDQDFYEAKSEGWA
jgi:hypothetical protein